MRITNRTHIIIGLLLVINLLIPVWFLFISDKKPDNQDKILKNVKQLVLLSERNNIVKEEAHPVAEEAVSLDKAPSVPEENLLTPEPEQGETLAENTQTWEEYQQQEPAEEAALPSAIESELPEQPVEEKPAEILCYTIGPFEQKKDKDFSQSQLARLAIDSKTRVILEKEISSYYLYIPPYKSRKAAMKTIAQLKKKKVRDFYLISKGDRKNAIALGLFSQEKHALRRFDTLKKLRFNVKMEARYRDKEIYWLDYQGTEDQINQIDLEKLSPLPLQLYSRRC